MCTGVHMSRPCSDVIGVIASFLSAEERECLLRVWPEARVHRHKWVAAAFDDVMAACLRANSSTSSMRLQATLLTRVTRDTLVRLLRDDLDIIGRGWRPLDFRIDNADLALWCMS